jgi:hypothetical protein
LILVAVGARSDRRRCGRKGRPAFHSDGQLLVSEVWDSREQLEAFGKRVMPLLADVALEHSGHPEVFEVHNIIRR